MEADRTELHDLAAQHPERVADMARQYEAWAERCGVCRARRSSTLMREPGRDARVLGEVRSAAMPSCCTPDGSGRGAGATAQRRAPGAAAPLAAPGLIAIRRARIHDGQRLGRCRAGRRRRPGAARDARRLRHRAGRRHQPPSSRDFVRATRYITDAEQPARRSSSTCRSPAALRAVGTTGRRAACLVAAGRGRLLAAPRGPGLAHPRPARASGRPRLLERCAGLLRMGRAAPAKRSGMGVRGARRPRGQALRLGRRLLSPTACRAATSGAATSRTRPPTAGTRARRRAARRAQRLRPVQRAAATSGNGARTGSARPITARRRPTIRASSGRPASVHARRLLPLPRLLLQPLPRGGAQRATRRDSAASNIGFRVAR